MSTIQNLAFKNKVVWITGASSGIGEELSRQISKMGGKLIISARNKKKLDNLCSTLSSEGGDCRVLDLDLEQLDKLQAKTRKALSYYGTIDYFISNAGVAVKDFVHNTTFEIDKKLMNINYFGPVYISKTLLPHFLDKKKGHIVVTSSLSGKYGVPRIASYAASKHALHGFFETLRSETHDKNIFITMVIPGIIKTNITAHALKGDGTSFGSVDKSFQEGYPVDKTAKKIIKSIINKKEEISVGGMERITLFLHRLSPWLLRRFIRNHPIKRMRKLKEFFK